MKISISRALVELNRTTSRIEKLIDTTNLVTYKVGDKVVDANFDAKSAFDQIKDLSAYRAKLKAAITLSNASTKVTLPLIGEVTIAEAIEYKSTLFLEEKFNATFQRQLAKARLLVERSNREMEESIERIVSASLGSSAERKGDEYEAIAKPFRKDKEASLVDPLNLEKMLEERYTEVQEFKDDVDIIINDSNAKTEIEIN